MSLADRLECAPAPLHAYQVFSAGPLRQDIEALSARHAAVIALGVICDTFIADDQVHCLPDESTERVEAFSLCSPTRVPVPRGVPVVCVRDDMAAAPGAPAQ